MYKLYIYKSYIHNKYMCVCVFNIGCYYYKIVTCSQAVL